MAEPATELSLDTASVLAAEEHEITIVGRSPWYLAWRRLRRNYFALFSLFVFILIVTACFLAPVYAHRVAHTGPNETHSAETVIVSGVPTKVISGGALSPRGDWRAPSDGTARVWLDELEANVP